MFNSKFLFATKSWYGLPHLPRKDWNWEPAVIVLTLGGFSRRRPKSTHFGKGTIRRMARRGGVKRVSSLIYEDAREAMRDFLTRTIRDAVTYTEFSRRATCTTLDVVFVNLAGELGGGTKDTKHLASGWLKYEDVEEALQEIYSLVKWGVQVFGFARKLQRR